MNRQKINQTSTVYTEASQDIITERKTKCKKKMYHMFQVTYRLLLFPTLGEKKLKKAARKCHKTETAALSLRKEAAEAQSAVGVFQTTKANRFKPKKSLQMFSVLYKLNVCTGFECFIMQGIVLNELRKGQEG